MLNAVTLTASEQFMLPTVNSIGESVNGKPAVSKTATRGSSPCSPAKWFLSQVGKGVGLQLPDRWFKSYRNLQYQYTSTTRYSLSGLLKAGELQERFLQERVEPLTWPISGIG